MTQHQEEAAQEGTTLPINSPDVFLPTELLATLSHELRSPLAIIKGYVTSLLLYDQMITPEERLDFLHSINEGSDRLAQTIDRILELTQLENGSVIIRPALVDLFQLLRTVTEEVEQEQAILQREHAVNLRQIQADGTTTAEDYLVLAEQPRLHTAFKNLLDNAFKYSPTGSPIDITIMPVQREQVSKHLKPSLNGRADTSELLSVTIRDYGNGIPPDQLERIFERLHRIEMNLIHEIHGLGLGLTISKHIIELHHGTIWAESTLGSGSTFSVILPRTTETTLAQNTYLIHNTVKD
ncbi:sensor histidine kinase [Dictyobacter arantiisoli]|uniref:histidine kinase n=1 Tax=Dictyobacter arantiisoli TaxID=2014874 RepID=A0A5A5TDF5_9CHLR|nr:HAMP domain-containing sensor histidine kinase [Dictyobacter arantiisoli]GCF09571.1 hypothetical protein KDI_31350 [Dictyobacter arantiisoli]